MLDKILTAKQFAKEQLELWGLSQQGWTFVFDNSLRRVGQCRDEEKEIGLSHWYLEKSTEAEIKETILHEIAHALQGPLEKDHNGRWDIHGPRWKALAIQVGAKPKALAGEEAKSAAKPKYKIKCENCGWQVYRHRMRRRNFGSRCPKCHTEVTIYTVTWKPKGGSDD